MKNKVYENFSKEKFNQDRNYQAIMSKIKEKKEMKKLKLSNLAAGLIAVLLVGTVGTQIYAKIKWNIEFHQYDQKLVETPKETINYAKESGFADKIEEDYVVQDGVGIKVDSLLVTDDCLDARVSFQFSEEKEVNSGTFEFGYVIYDENKNIYGLQTRMHMDTDKERNLTMATLEKLGVTYDPNVIYDLILNDSANIESVETTEERTIVKDITLRAKDSFPKSQKIFIRFFDLGYLMMNLDGVDQTSFDQIDKEDFVITNEEWIFEKELSEKFSQRETLELTLKEEIPGLEIEKCTLTETGMVLIFKSEEYMSLVGTVREVDGKLTDPTRNMLTITDENGKVYAELESGGMENNTYKMNIDAGKKDLEKKLFVNFIVRGEKYTSELIEK